MAKTPAKRKPAAKKAAAKAKPAARAKSATAKKPAAKKAPAKRTAAKKAPARKAATTARKPAARKAPARKTAAGKTAKPAARKSAAAKPATRKPAARKAPASKTPARKAPTRKAPARKAPAGKALSRAGDVARTSKPARALQRFAVSHKLEGDFKQDGLRPYAVYRDLGFAAATGGLAQAHVIRLVGPCDPKQVSKLHAHDVDFQMVYVLKGWMKSDFDGQGEQLMREGTAWLQPPGIKHKVLDYSDDCEVLEVILPAQFDTLELE